MREHLDVQELLAAYTTKALEQHDYEAAAPELLDHLARCAPCRELYVDMNEVSADLALAVPAMALPDGAHERMLSLIRSDGAVTSAPEQGRRGTRVARRFGIAAAAAMLAALGVWNLSLTSDVRELRAAAERRSTALTLLNRPDVRRIALAGNAGHGTMHLAIAPNGVATLVGTDVPSLGGRVLEAWLIRDDGKPVAAGVFKPEFGTVIGLIGVDLAKDRAIAITIERRLVDEPTGEPVYQASLRA